jgi:uncharacterized protein (TIGR03435 family)
MHQENAMKRLRTVVASAGIVLSLQPCSGAQESFDAASIKRSAVKSLADVTPVEFQESGRWSARGATLAMLLRSAYALPSNSIIGIPSWARNERFDVVTTTAPYRPLNELRAMAQQLLAGRFGLRAHREERRHAVYALVRVKSSGLLGPGLRPSSARCERRLQGLTTRSLETRALDPCSELITSRDGVMRFELRGRPLMDLLIISGARGSLDRPIVDRTNLVGNFDIELEFIPSATIERSNSEFGLPFREAIVNQLGLRLERAEELSGVLVIDSITAPSLD